MVLYGSLPFDTRVKREAVALRNAGYEVVVHDTDWDLGEVNNLRGINRWSVTRVPIRRRASLTHLLRFWLRATLLLLSRRHEIDIVHAHDLTGLPPAALLKLVTPRIRLVYDSHELFPEAARDKVSFAAYVLFLAIELVCGRMVDVVITVSPSMVKTLGTRLPKPVFLVMNVPDVEDVVQQIGTIPQCDPQTVHNKTRVAYSGNVLLRRGYEQLVSAAEVLSRRHPGRYEFWIIGGGPFLPAVKRLVRERGLEDTFVFTGQVKFAELLTKTVNCDIAVALYGDTWNNNVGLSNKLFEYMMLGMPMIFTRLVQSVPILRRTGALIVNNPVDPKELADAIVRLTQDIELRKEISTRCRRLIRGRFNWARESQSLLQAYDALAAG